MQKKPQLLFYFGLPGNELIKMFPMVVVVVNLGKLDNAHDDFDLSVVVAFL